MNRRSFFALPLALLVPAVKAAPSAWAPLQITATAEQMRAASATLAGRGGSGGGRGGGPDTVIYIKNDHHTFSRDDIRCMLEEIDEENSWSR